MRVGQKRRRDANEPEIVKGLRKAGAYVRQVSGPGLPDLLIFYRKKWHVIEIKTTRGRLTDAQLNTRALAPFPVAVTLEDALKAIGAL